MADYAPSLAALQANIESVVLGKTETVRQVLVALLAGGHVLLEDAPGVGKTVLARAVAHSVNCTFSRIQLTPDMLPTDILGVSVYDSATGQFLFKRGAVFAHILLADEINRTTPRTQSALLEAMNEAQVSMDGQTYPLGPPFMVIATQNPVQYEGTYFLPENQLDRFMLRVRLGYPDRATERRILIEQPSRRRLETLGPVLTIEQLLELQRRVAEVEVDEAILDYVVAIAEATRREDHLAMGMSPRASLALVQAARAAAMLAGRSYAVPDDVKRLARPVLAHRLISRAVVEDGALGTEALLDRILQSIPAPQ